MSPEERAARGARDETVPLPKALKANWEQWADELAHEGLKLIRGARTTRNLKAASDKRAQGIRLLEASEKFYLRARRNPPDAAPAQQPAGEPADADSLDTFRRGRPRA